MLHTPFTAIHHGTTPNYEEGTIKGNDKTQFSLFQSYTMGTLALTSGKLYSFVCSVTFTTPVKITLMLYQGNLGLLGVMTVQLC